MLQLMIWTPPIPTPFIQFPWGNQVYANCPEVTIYWESTMPETGIFHRPAYLFFLR